MVTNYGRLTDFINGITGVAANANAIVNMPVNARYFNVRLNSQAVNYTDPVVTFTTPPGGTPATFTSTVTNGVISAIAIATAGTGQTPGNYNLSITDPTGTGATASAVVDAGGAVTATPTVTSGGTPSPINPVNFYDYVYAIVNGVVMRDIDVADILRIATTNGYNAERGELPLFFVNPSNNFISNYDVNSWDLFGQSTFSLQMKIKAGVVNPVVTGSKCYDFFRNVRPDNGRPFLNIVQHHSYNLNLAAGRNDITTIPFDKPITRIWFRGATPGNISEIDILQDKNTPLQLLVDQYRQQLQSYGFKMGLPDYVNANWSTDSALQSAFNEPSYFDTAFIADIEGRPRQALKCEDSLVVRVYSDVAQAVNVTVESLSGAYA